MTDTQQPDPATTDALIAFGRAVAESGLLASTCGNISLRVNERWMALSASGAELKRLNRDDVVLVSLDDGTATGASRASMEAELHRRVYLARAGANAIVHCQSQAATLLACAAEPTRNLDFFPELPAYVRAHAYVTWAMPGSEELATAVAQAFEDPEVTVVQMRNHGQVVIGRDWQRAVRRGVFFEMACWMATQKFELRTIPTEDATRLRSFSRDV